MGNATDSSTGFNFANAKVYEWMSGQQYWDLLQSYNQTTIQTARENGCFVIDAATNFPKSRLVFYDMLHFTNEGARQFADSVFQPLQLYLKEKINKPYLK